MIISSLKFGYQPQPKKLNIFLQKKKIKYCYTPKKKKKRGLFQVTIIFSLKLDNLTYRVEFKWNLIDPSFGKLMFLITCFIYFYLSRLNLSTIKLYADLFDIFIEPNIKLFDLILSPHLRLEIVGTIRFRAIVESVVKTKPDRPVQPVKPWIGHLFGPIIYILDF